MRATEYRTLHCFEVPFAEVELFSIRGSTRAQQSRYELHPFLDPKGICQHYWQGFGRSGEGLIPRVRGIGAWPALNIIADDPDFAHFLDAHPNVLERIRKTLREHGCVREGLTEEFEAWKNEKLNGTTDPCFAPRQR